MMDRTYYGWFSIEEARIRTMEAEQADARALGTFAIYEVEDGRTVVITRMTHTQDLEDDDFPDIECVGKLVKRTGKISYDDFWNASGADECPMFTTAEEEERLTRKLDEYGLDSSTIVDGLKVQRDGYQKDEPGAAVSEDMFDWSWYKSE